jgi:hypothetical protein
MTSQDALTGRHQLNLFGGHRRVLVVFMRRLRW